MVKVENKMQLLHIVAEAIVIGGVYYTLNKKYNDVNTKYQILSKKFEEQSLLIKQHEQMIQQLIGLVESLNRDASIGVTNAHNLNTPQQKPKIISRKQSKLAVNPQPLLRTSVKKEIEITNEDQLLDPNLTENDNENENENEDPAGLSETESELDAELMEELEELNSGVSLKKQ